MSERLGLRSERLDLPPLDATHPDALAAIYADPAVSAYIGGARLSYEGTRAQLARFAAIWREHGRGQSAVIERATGRMIGRVGLHYWRLGFRFDRQTDELTGTPVSVYRPDRPT